MLCALGIPRGFVALGVFRAQMFCLEVGATKLAQILS
jgi:hypothetical protein